MHEKKYWAWKIELKKEKEKKRSFFFFWWVVKCGNNSCNKDENKMDAKRESRMKRGWDDSHPSLSLSLSVSRSLCFVFFVVLSRKKKTKSRAPLRSSSRCCYCCYSAISFCFFHLCLVVSRIACISDLRLLGNAIAASFVWKIWRFLQHLMSKGAVLFGRDERRRRGRRGK